jgi:hypothetical protein
MAPLQELVDRVMDKLEVPEAMREECFTSARTALTIIFGEVRESRGLELLDQVTDYWSGRPSEIRMYFNFRVYQDTNSRC